MKAGWLVCWLTVVSLALHAQPVLPFGVSTDGVAIEKPFLQQLQQPPAQATKPAALTALAGRWKATDNINYGRRYFSGWARFSVRSPQTRTVWLELTTHFMDSVSVWVSAPNSPPRRIRGPSSWREQTTALAPVHHYYFLYAVRLPASQPTTVWIRGRVLPGDALKFGVRLWSPGRFLAAQQRSVWGWAVFVGLVLAILSGVLISFVFYRRRLYLFYGCYVACLSIYALLNDGWGAFLPDSWAWLDDQIILVHWLNLGFGLFVRFSRRFLLVAPGPGWLRVRWPELIPMAVIGGATLVAQGAQQQGNGELVDAMWVPGYAGFIAYALIWGSYVADALKRRFRLAWLLIGGVSTLLLFLLMDAILINFGFMDSPLPDMLALRIGLLLELAILSIGWLYRRKQLQMARQQLEAQNRTLQTELIQTQETDRQRIAADLHDDLGGTLATIRRRLVDIRQMVQSPQVARQLDDLAPMIQKSSDDLRRIAHNLMPPEFERIGLSEAIKQLVNSQPAQPTLFSFVTSGDEQKLSVDIELNAYRIVAELIQNINKHARASQAAIQLIYQPDRLTLTVEDDGLGWRTNTMPGNKPGIGLKNCNLRAEYIGATLWRDASEAGTFVMLGIPYSSPANVTPAPRPNPAD